MWAPLLLLFAQQSSIPFDSNIILLSRIKNRMGENLRGLPNYTCTQTIERSQRQARSKRFRLIDTLRLEVALVEGKELFAWPGAAKFEDRELREIVGTGGAIGNGNFALHAKSVFMSNAVRFQYEGEGELNGRRTIRFKFDVPRLLSGFRLRSANAEGISAYHGDFDADAETLDVLRLSVIAHDIPPNVPITSASDTLWYTRARIGESDYLLPQSSELLMVDIYGTENKNRVQFSNCHQYAGESTISFADAPPALAASTPPVVTVELPAGLSLDTALVRPLHLDKMIIGDVFEAHLISNARHDKKTIVPKGATVKIRILGFEKTYRRTDLRILTFELFEVDFPGARADVRAIPESITLVTATASNTGVDKQGIIYISGTRQELIAGTRILWRIENKQGRQLQ